MSRVVTQAARSREKLPVCARALLAAAWPRLCAARTMRKPLVKPGLVLVLALIFSVRAVSG